MVSRVGSSCGKRAGLDGTAAWWRDEALPELRDLYARIAAIDVDGLYGTALVDVLY